MPRRRSPRLLRFLARWRPSLSRSGSSEDALRRLFLSNFRVSAPFYVAAFVALAAQSGATGYSAWLLKDVVNQVFVERQMLQLYLFAGLIVGLYAAKGAAAYVSTWMLSIAGNAVVARVQTGLYDSLLRQDSTFFARHSVGDLIVRTTSNAQAARSVLDTLIVSIGRDGTTLIALVTVMLLQNWMLTLASCAATPLAILALRRLKRRVEDLAKRELSSSAQIVTAIQEAIHGIRVVKAFGLEARMQREIDVVIGRVEARANDINRLSAATSPMMELFGGVAIAIVVAIGGFQVIHQGQDPGSFFSFITALLLAYEPAKRLAGLHISLGNGLVGLRMMYEILDAAPAIADRADVAPFAAETVAIGFEDVAFAYRPEQPVLAGVSFRAEAGSITALVGPSGAGKSTLFSLLERFYDVTGGRITFNGEDIRAIRLADLRRHIALVTQDTFLFEGSIASNIADGRPDASRAEIEAAARDANAYDFILALPQGFDTPVTGGGTSLSGGQRQRIAIARALLRQAPVLLLDEATSALDAQSEAEVQDALARLMRGRTTLVIAHRLSTVRNADRICVLDQGRLVQSGSHDDLIAEGGLYAHLHALQFREKPAAAEAGAETIGSEA